MRKVISQRLQEAKSYIPHFYVSLKIDPQPMMDIREQLKHHGIKVTFNDFVVRASALALRKHPNINSGFNSSTNSILRFKTIDISIAVSLPAGLITPIVRHADFKNIGEISQEVKELAARAKEGKLEPQEYKGGSFTISNLGMYGVSEFIAIINPPQAAILAVSGILEVPVVKNGQIIPGHEMTLTLSGDHRVIDGVAGAEFLKTLQKLLENPSALLI
jgi:pyruvate dehydrogenase E2 component (dihydrolipoamide acetyltransferase)